MKNDAPYKHAPWPPRSRRLKQPCLTCVYIPGGTGTRPSDQTGRSWRSSLLPSFAWKESSFGTVFQNVSRKSSMEISINRHTYFWTTKGLWHKLTHPLLRPRASNRTQQLHSKEQPATRTPHCFKPEQGASKFKCDHLSPAAHKNIYAV